MSDLRNTVVLLALPALCCPAGSAAQERDPISSARQAIEAGDLLLKEGSVQPACAQYELACGIAPEWWYPAYKKALCDMASGNYRNAFYLLKKAHASRAELYVIHLALARWHRLNGNPDEAQREYETAIRVTKGAVEPMVELADLLATEGKKGEARLVLKRAEHFSPTNVAVRRRLASLSEELHFFADAELHLRFLAQRGVNPRRDLADLARFYQRRGENDLAQQVLRALAELPRQADPLLPPPKGDFAQDAAKEVD
jgi:tetratricopeptide (TPR) repeat protein